MQQPMSARRGLLALLLGASVLLGQLGDARAGGLFLPFHGVRGLGRAGAMVAGADDAGGIWYNPATMDRVGGIELLLDGAMILYSMRYTRIDSGGNVLPTVENQNTPLPIPTLAAVAPIWRDRLWIGGSLSAGSGVLPSYRRPNYGPCDPQRPGNCIDTAHFDAPQRYTMVSFEGTFFLRLDLSLAWRATEWLTVGISLQNTIGRLSQVKAITSYNGTLSSGPEDPDFDSLTDVKMTSLFNPSALLGVTVRPHPAVTVGATFQLPMRITSEAELAVQLPVSPLYAASTVQGRTADVTIDFPLAVALGVEFRPPWVEGLRVELDLVYENWASVDSIRFAPKDIRILDLPGVGTYEVPETREDLGFQDTLSVRLGVEYALPFWGRALVLRAGYGYESDGTPIERTSLVSADFKKHLLTLGASYSYSRFRFDAGLGVIFTPRRFVSHETSEAPQINPINPDDVATVGGGTYEASYVVLGLGLNVRI
jgi:long-chain fatty acid transport protein